MSNQSQRIELLNAETSIKNHLLAHDSNAKIYDELRNLRNEDVKHGQNFDKDLEAINKYLHDESALRHLPAATIEGDGKNGFSIIFDGTQEQDRQHKPPTELPTYPLPAAVQSAIQAEQQHHHPAGQAHPSGRFPAPEEVRGGRSQAPADKADQSRGAASENNDALAAGDHGMSSSSAKPSENNFGKNLLERLGLPVTAKNLAFLDAWQRAEGGSADNPFNTTQNMPGAKTLNSVGVKRYSSMDEGLEATVKSLQLVYYKGILAALRTEDTRQAANALHDGPWGTKNIHNFT